MTSNHWTWLHVSENRAICTTAALCLESWLQLRANQNISWRVFAAEYYRRHVSVITFLCGRSNRPLYGCRSRAPTRFAVNSQKFKAINAPSGEWQTDFSTANQWFAVDVWCTRWLLKLTRKTRTSRVSIGGSARRWFRTSLSALHVLLHCLCWLYQNWSLTSLGAHFVAHSSICYSQQLWQNFLDAY